MKWRFCNCNLNDWRISQWDTVRSITKDKSILHDHTCSGDRRRKKERKPKLTIIKSENLPLESSPARIRIPTWSLRVEDGLRECEPLRLVGRRIGKIEFCGTHGGDSPKSKRIEYACMVSSKFLLSLFFVSLFFHFSHTRKLDHHFPGIWIDS